MELSEGVVYAILKPVTTDLLVTSLLLVVFKVSILFDTLDYQDLLTDLLSNRRMPIEHQPSLMELSEGVVYAILKPVTTDLLVTSLLLVVFKVSILFDIAALKAKMAEINKNLMRVLQVNQQVKAVSPTCETCGGPHSFNDCPAIIGQTHNVYVAGAYQDTFYNGLTLRHHDTINAAASETFMKRRPKECYDLIENMTAHHNDLDTLAQLSESSSSITSSFDTELQH
nr:reverse transcriptase domain-containing protein [Tanacetum cinerariifolium]